MTIKWERTGATFAISQLRVQRIAVKTGYSEPGPQASHEKFAVSSVTGS